MKALKNSAELQALLTEHEQFERTLKTRKYEEPNSNLEERIITASLHKDKKRSFSPGAYLSELLAEFSLSKPALAAVTVLMVFVLITGFVIGFTNQMTSASTEQEETNIQEFLYYEGELL